MPYDRSGSSPHLRWSGSARARWRSRYGQYFRPFSERKSFTLPPAACWARRLPRSALGWSVMLPLMAGIVTMRSSAWATTLVAACIVVPQLVVAAFSPSVGRWAQRWGRRPMLLLGFAALPIRGVLFMVITDPHLLVAVQLLD